MKTRTVAVMMEVETKLSLKELKDFFIKQPISNETAFIKQIQGFVIDKTK